eukprot:2107985-Lingulodinium_polyedra.AAC.1
MVRCTFALQTSKCSPLRYSMGTAVPRPAADTAADRAMQPAKISRKKVRCEPARRGLGGGAGAAA